MSAPFGGLTLPPGDGPLLLASAGIGAARRHTQLIARGVLASDIHYEVFGPDLWLAGRS
ncbi:hypothetical protein JOL79_32725 [Microbispora sp. RL4-1S]|uniref:Uncharacterized protein n=1 Tax=Microbispora oryzae TaxID=2806554 RepID=A0A940WWF0_9ACTN|nr:hypothetical protein [Microbispora oryzae]MBP2708546.1 hypothetical protein [Microbispora oryzae]